MRFRLLLLLFLLIPSLSNAQFSGDSFLETNTRLDLQPSLPSPGEVVTVTLNDYGGGGFGSKITWLLDGVEVNNSSNKRSIEVLAGPDGSKSTIEAVLTSPNNGTQIVSHTIRPLYLDLIIEPQTHVPDFYTGRALPSVGSVVNVTALLSGTSIATSDLIYTWKVGQIVLEGGPLRGQNQISFIAPQGRQFVLSLQVTNLSGVALAKRTMYVPSVAPKLLFYGVNELYGTNHRPVTANYIFVGNSVSILAEPFYLDSKVYNDPDIATWKLNNKEFSSDNNPYLIDLQRVGFGGNVDLNFHVRSTTNFLQGAEEDIVINF